MKKSGVWYLVSGILYLASCSPSAPPPSGGPAADVGSAPPVVSSTPEGMLSIAKGDLGKELLLQASFIVQSGSIIAGSPTSLGLQSRIIQFAEQDSNLFMMESAKGLTANAELPSERILAGFKIVKEEGENIVFDFNEGMKKIFLIYWINTGDKDNFPQPEVPSIGPSFLKEVSPVAGGLWIRQVAQLELRGEVLPVEVRYHLTPYQPDPAFRPVLNPGLEKMGYFESAPSMKPDFGYLQNNILKWNTVEPVLFYISANTPEEFRGAVREGILYWNKAFGKEVVRAEMAPEGVTAPHPAYNMVQWVTNHTAGGAYADVQSDPRTGEILHAQIYLTSVFAEGSRDGLTRRKRVKEFQNAKGEKGPVFGLKGFSSRPLCRLPNLEAPSPGTDPLKMVQDYIRNVTAHEVGHTLGLRHNFASSQNTALDPEETQEVFEDYLETGSLKEPFPPASSVMDYPLLEGRILIGDYVGREETPALPYDWAAIQWGYFGAEPAIEFSEILYCGDEQADGFYEDCRRLDGGNPLLQSAHDFQKMVFDLPEAIAQTYLSAKTNFDERKLLPVEKVPLHAENASRLLTQPLADLVRLLQGDFNSLAVEHRFGSAVTDINRKEIERLKTDWLNEAIAQGGGIEKLLKTIAGHSLYKQMREYPSRWERLIQKEAFAENFNELEQAVMKKNTGAFFKMVGEKVVEKVTAILAGVTGGGFAGDSENLIPPGGGASAGGGKFRWIKDLKSLETAGGNWAAFIITEGAESVPTFDGELRLLAVEILKPGLGPTADWQGENRKNVLKMLLEKLEKRFGAPLATLDSLSLSREESRALREEKRIVEALGLQSPADPEHISEGP